ATGTGAFDLTGLLFVRLTGLIGGAWRTAIWEGRITGPSGTFPYIGVSTNGYWGTLRVPAGYVSGTPLSRSATYSDASLGTLGVTPGTYVWKWGTGANQNVTLQIKTPVPARTAIWYLNNNAFVAGTYAPTLPVGWKVVGVVDFNGDSHPDYLLYNTSTHQTVVWYLNNNVFVGAAFGPTLPANWNVVGVADFDADGRPDYLLFNSTSHQTAIWYLSGTTFVSGAFGPIPPN